MSSSQRHKASQKPKSTEKCKKQQPPTKSNQTRRTSINRSKFTKVSQAYELASKYREAPDPFNSQDKTFLAILPYRQEILPLMAEKENLTKQIQASLATLSKEEVPNNDSREKDQSNSYKPNNSDPQSQGPTGETINSQLTSLADKPSRISAQKLPTTIDHLETKIQQLPKELRLFRSKAYLLINGENRADVESIKADKDDPIVQKIAVEQAQPKQALEPLQRLVVESDYRNNTDQIALMLSKHAEAKGLSGEAVIEAQYWADLAAIAPEEIDLKKLINNARQWLEKGENEAAITQRTALNAMIGQQPMLMDLLTSRHEPMHNHETAEMVYHETIQPNYLTY